MHIVNTCIFFLFCLPSQYRFKYDKVCYGVNVPENLRCKCAKELEQSTSHVFFSSMQCNFHTANFFYKWITFCLIYLKIFVICKYLRLLYQQGFYFSSLFFTQETCKYNVVFFLFLCQFIYNIISIKDCLFNKFCSSQIHLLFSFHGPTSIED